MHVEPSRRRPCCLVVARNAPYDDDDDEQPPLENCDAVGDIFINENTYMNLNRGFSLSSCSRALYKRDTISAEFRVLCISYGDRRYHHRIDTSTNDEEAEPC